jgi:hypothetical protein
LRESLPSCRVQRIAPCGTGQADPDARWRAPTLVLCSSPLLKGRPCPAPPGAKSMQGLFAGEPSERAL